MSSQCTIVFGPFVSTNYFHHTDPEYIKDKENEEETAQES